MRHAWALLVLGCGLVPGQDHQTGRQRAAEPSHTVHVTLDAYAPLFEFDSKRGALVATTTVAAYAGADASTSAVTLEYLSENAHWLWVGSVDQPRFVARSAVLGSPTADDSLHPWIQDQSVLEFAAAGLPVWTADTYGGCPEYTFDGQGRLDPVEKLILRGGGEFDANDPEAFDYLLFAVHMNDYVMGEHLQLSSNHCLQAHVQLATRFEILREAWEVDSRDGFIDGFAKHGHHTFRLMAEPKGRDRDLLVALGGRIYDANQAGQLWFAPPHRRLQQLDGLPKIVIDNATFGVMLKYNAQAIAGSYMADPHAESCLRGTRITDQEAADFLARIVGDMDFEELIDDRTVVGEFADIAEMDVKEFGQFSDPKTAAHAIIAHLSAIQGREFKAVRRPDSSWSFIAGEDFSVQGSTRDEYTDDGDYVGFEYTAHTHPYVPCGWLRGSTKSQEECVCLGASARISMQGGVPIIESGDVKAAFHRESHYTDIVSPIFHGAWDGDFLVVHHEYPSSGSIAVRTAYGVVEAQLPR